MIRVFHNDELAHKALQKRLVVQGSEVVPYHRDTDSEDDEYSELEEEEEDDDDDSQEDADVGETRSKVIIGNDETPRYTTCEHCKEGFDVMENTRVCS